MNCETTIAKKLAKQICNRKIEVLQFAAADLLTFMHFANVCLMGRQKGMPACAGSLAPPLSGNI
jgi:hypothetical protein